ncbi:MAG: hypothetical protein LUD74_04935 [Tannerellaceae bacterium]|nr:hypothetical protein [Tannerellaceae bacterium]
MSLNTMLQLLIRYFSATLAEQEQAILRQAISRFAPTHPLLATYLAKDSKEKKQLSAIPFLPPLQTYIGNAGLVLISPFFPLLFSRLGLTGTHGFKSEDEQVKAIYMLQYLIWGHTDFPEYEMELNRLLTNYPATTVIGRCPELVTHEKTTANGMLEGALQNWKKLQGTSIAGLREGFLQREGSLEEKEDSYLLQVETKSYDILLDTIPWNFRTINYSWMEKPLFINWR